MVTAIKKLVARHLALSEQTLSVSPFFHGAARPDKKILFLVTDGEKPVCMVKIIRDSAFNEKLQRECTGQKEGGRISPLFHAPKVFFEDILGGHFLYAEEVPQGLPVGKERAAEFLDAVADFEHGLVKGKELSVADRVSFFGEGVRIPSEAEMYLEILREHMSLVFYSAVAHGDLTYMNIIDGPGGTFLIDWERFGERPIWGIDFVHYLVRCFGVRSREDFQSVCAAKHWLSSVPPAYSEALFALDMLLDVLQKKDEEMYRAFIKTLN